MKKRGNKKKSPVKINNKSKRKSKKMHSKKMHSKKRHSSYKKKARGTKRKRSRRSSRGSSHKVKKRRKRYNLDFREVKSIINSNSSISSTSSNSSKDSFASRELEPIKKEDKMNEHYYYAFSNVEEVAERIKINTHKNEHVKDCYPRSLYLLGLIDIKLKEAISAETFHRFHNTTEIVDQVLENKYKVPLEKIQQYTEPNDLRGNIYEWAQRNIPLNNFVLIIIQWKPDQEGPGSHALLMGKVKMDKIDIRSRPKYDRLNEEEIMLIDTQVGDMHGHHNYVYNLGETQMMRYLDTYNFERQHMAVLRLRLDLNDVFSRLSIDDEES